MRAKGSGHHHDGRGAAAAAWLIILRIWPSLKTMAPLLAATLICSILTLVVPVEKWLGSQFYLILPYLYLFLNPAGATVGQHIENIVLVLIGCAIALSVSFLALCGTVWIDDNSKEVLYLDYPLATTRSKAVASCTLVAGFFIGGLLGSIYPRLNNAVRAALFSATLALTRGAERIEWRNVSDFWYPLCLASGASLIANIFVTPKTANSRFALLLVKTLDDTGEVVRRTVAEFFESSGMTPLAKTITGRTGTNAVSDDLLRLRKDMIASASDFADALDVAAHEVSFARMPASKWRSILSPTRRITTWISCGLGMGSEDAAAEVAPPPAVLAGSSVAAAPKTTTADFRPSVEQFAQEIVRSLEVVADIVKLILAPRSTHTRASPCGDVDSPGFDTGVQVIYLVEGQQTKLQNAVAAFRVDLDSLLELPQYGSTSGGSAVPDHHDGDTLRNRASARMAAAPPGQPTLFKSSIYEMSFLMVSLLEIAKEADVALRASHQHLLFWQAHPRRTLWWPIVPWKHWLRQAGGGLISPSSALTEVHVNHHSMHMQDDEEEDGGSEHAEQATYTAREEDEYVRRIFADDKDEEKRVDVKESGPAFEGSSVNESTASQQKSRWTGRRLMRAVHSWVRRPGILRMRFKASRTLKRIKTSRHFHFAFKLTLGASLLSLPGWLGTTREWYLTYRGAWSIVSFLWVMETSSGATVITAIRRVAGTIMGCVLGLVTYKIAHGNGYALAILMTIALIPSVYLVTLTTMPAVGIVSGTALSLVVGITYSQHAYPPLHGDVQSVGIIAVIRGYEVGAGIVAALLINLFLWPYHARVKCVANIARATTQMQQLYTSLARQMLQRGFVTTPETAMRFAKMEGALQKRLYFSRSLLAVMDAEVSLVLRPVALLDGFITRLERISNLLIALRHCREQGLRHLRTDIVLSVFGPRQDLVSCVSLTLWTIGQALRTRSPLPQFLPSPRLALRDLTMALRAQMEAGGESRRGSRVVVVDESRRASRPNVEPPPPPPPDVTPVPPAKIPDQPPDAYHALMRLGEPHWRSSRRPHQSTPGSRRGSPGHSGASTPRAADLNRRTHGSGRAVREDISEDRPTIAPRPTILRRQTEPDGTSRGSGSGDTATAPPTSGSAPLSSVRNRTYLWMFAEHSILSTIIRELESLLDETRDLCGEVTFIHTEYLPEFQSTTATVGHTREMSFPQPH